MHANELSILIPARNEEFLSRTIDDILEHIEADTEILVGLDGAWANPPINDHPRVTVLHTSKSIGQRAMTNRLAALSKAKYVMKVDAHCAFDQGFDRKLIEDMQDDWTVVPIMRNLHVFDWVCPQGHRQYQDKGDICIQCPNGHKMGKDDERCKTCGKACGKSMSKDVVWQAKSAPNSTAFRFDRTLKFAYWNPYKAKQTGDLVETLSLQGSCFMLTREKYWELNICDETWGSWGHQGSEVALKTWLSGGRVIVNKKTWYAHMFRTKPGVFGHPYHNPESEVEKTRQACRDLFLNDKWEKAVMPLAELINKFAPVPEWD